MVMVILASLVGGATASSAGFTCCNDNVLCGGGKGKGMDRGPNCPLATPFKYSKFLSLLFGSCIFTHFSSNSSCFSHFLPPWRILLPVPSFPASHTLPFPFSPRFPPPPCPPLLVTNPGSCCNLLDIPFWKGCSMLQILLVLQSVWCS